MLQEISSSLDIILTTLWIIFVIIIIIYVLQLLYPNYSFWGNKNKVESEKEESSEEEDIVDPTTDLVLESSVGTTKAIKLNAEYKKYNEKFRIIPIDSVVEPDTKIIKSNKISYNELKELIGDDDFLNGYLESVRISLKIKLKSYMKERKQTIAEISANNGGGNSATNMLGKGDSHMELLIIREKVLGDIIQVIKERAKELSIEKLKKNFKSMLYNKEKGFVSLVGRDNIKNFIAGQIYTFYKNPNVILDDSQGIRLLGNSGTGKTRVAQTLAFIYSKSFMLEYEDVIEKSPKDLSSHLMNGDKENTYKILLLSLGKVLFIDEAYGITGTGFSLDRKYGEGVITELVAFDTGHTGRYIPILAGYEKEMEVMFDTNQGLDRRFPHKFILEDYTSKQLTDILIGSIKKKDSSLELDEGDQNFIYTYVEALYTRNKSIFAKQGSDMIKLASSILTSIYVSNKYYWETGVDKFVHRAYLITSGFNSYLESKGWSIAF
jgi:hypothetical protein